MTVNPAVLGNFSRRRQGAIINRMICGQPQNMTSILVPMHCQEFVGCHITPEGANILQGNTELYDALGDFWESEYPEVALASHGKMIEAGGLCHVREIGSIAVKISSATSSNASELFGIAFEPEDVDAQFHFLGELRNHLLQRDETIITPRQYFLARSHYGMYLHGQEYMRDWLTLRRWSETVFEIDEQETDLLDFCSILKSRIQEAVEGTSLDAPLNDLFYDYSRINFDNILVPCNAKPNPDIRICIIDQPGPNADWKIRRLALDDSEVHPL